MDKHEAVAILLADRPVRYAYPNGVEGEADIPCVSPYDVTQFRVDGMYPILEFDDIARGECTHGQSSTVHRSNFRRLVEDHQGCRSGTSCCTIVRYSNVDVLAIFPHLACDEMVRSLVHLRHEYPIYDEDDLSALEDEEVYASWAAYLRYDIRDEFDEETLEKLDTMDEDDARELFFLVVHQEGERGNPPEHNGLEVLWGSFLRDTETLSEFARVIGLRAAGTLCPGDFCLRPIIDEQDVCGDHSAHATLEVSP